MDGTDLAIQWSLHRFNDKRWVKPEGSRASLQHVLVILLSHNRSGEPLLKCFDSWGRNFGFADIQMPN